MLCAGPGRFLYDLYQSGSPTSGQRIRTCFAYGIFILLFAFLILTVLKVFMAYQCESHLWNSLTGCVPLSAVANVTNTTADVAGNATAAASKALGLPTLFT